MHENNEGHEREGERRHERWMIDKKVPLALMLLILIQTGGVVWWAAALDGRVTRLEIQSTEAGSVKIVERLVRLEVVMEQVGNTLKSMDNRLEERARQRAEGR